MDVIQDRMEFSLKRRKVKGTTDLDEKMLDVEQQNADVEQRKLQIETERLHLEIERLKERRSEPIKSGTIPTAVKLPKLDFMKFRGELLKWQEFWDCFDSAIHSNPSLSPVDKLRAKLEGHASEVIAGRALTNENYEEAIKLWTMPIIPVLWI